MVEKKIDIRGIKKEIIDEIVKEILKDKEFKNDIIEAVSGRVLHVLERLNTLAKEAVNKNVSKILEGYKEELEYESRKVLRELIYEYVESFKDELKKKVVEFLENDLRDLIKEAIAKYIEQVLEV